jgi:predicted acyl esterase
MTGRYEMLVEQNAEMPMRDGAILRANVYRPDADARFPVLMTFGPYGKDVPLREFMQEAWDRLNQTYPEILARKYWPLRLASTSSSSALTRRCGSRTGTLSST